MSQLLEQRYAVYRVDVLTAECEPLAETPYFGEAIRWLDAPWELLADVRRTRFTRLDGTGMPIAIVEDLLGRISVLCIHPVRGFANA